MMAGENNSFKKYSDQCMNQGSSAGARVTDIYSALGKTYDDVMQVVKYNDPFVLRDVVANFANGGLDRDMTQFIDFGCGSGIMGKLHSENGFRHFTGIDATRALTEQAEESGLYQKVYTMFVGKNNDSFPKELRGNFDVAVSTGCFMKDHFPHYAIDDMVASLKDGGLIFFGCRDIDFEEDPHQLGYGQKCKELEEAGKIERMDRHRFIKNKGAEDPNPYFGEQPGSIHAFKVNK